MARSLLFSASVAGILLLWCVAVSATATNVTYTGQKITITQPGTYILTNDITNSSQLLCIEIQASNVVFDGAGHLIDGNDAENSAGIFIHGSTAISGVTIKNVRVQDWYYGIYLYEARNLRIESSTLSSNAFTGAVLYKNAAGNTVTSSAITGNDYGLIFSDGAANCVVTNNVIRENDRGLYVYLSDGTTISGNTITNNINTGLQLHASGGGKIYNNRLNNNLNVAFYGEPLKANIWSVTPDATSWNPANIIGGPKIGGNYWARPDNTGFSQTNPDANIDGFCDTPLILADLNVDSYPLSLYTSSPSGPSYRGNGTLWLEQTAPAEEGTTGTATLYMNSSWEVPVKEVMLNLSWDGTVMEYVGTVSKAGGTVLAERSESSGLTLRFDNMEILRRYEKVALAEVSFRGTRAGSSPLSPKIWYVHGNDHIHLWVWLSSATAMQGTFVVDAAAATPTLPSGVPGVAVPSGVGLPTDPDGDGKYEDVDGDGVFGFADLVQFFNQMTWIAGNEPIAAFDINGNGRIDFADVVWLFNTL